MNTQTGPMVAIGIRLPVPHWWRLVERAKERGLVTQAGRPNVSAAAREVLAEVLDAECKDAREGARDD